MTNVSGFFRILVFEYNPRKLHSRVFIVCIPLRFSRLMGLHLAHVYSFHIFRTFHYFQLSKFHSNSIVSVRHFTSFPTTHFSYMAWLTLIRVELVSSEATALVSVSKNVAIIPHIIIASYITTSYFKSHNL